MNNKQFRVWLLKTYTREQRGGNWGWWLEKTPWSFKWGVYLEFLDGVGIHISPIVFANKESHNYTFDIWRDGKIIYDAGRCSTREQAQQFAVGTAFEMLIEEVV